MTAQFQANKVSVNESGRDIWSVIRFDASHRAHGSDYVTLQRGFKFDDPHSCIGRMDISIGWQGQKWISHGVTHTCNLERHRLVVAFSDAAPAWIDEYRNRHRQAFQRLEVTFDLSDEQFRCLRAGLHRLYEGLDCYVEPAT